MHRRKGVDQRSITAERCVAEYKKAPQRSIILVWHNANHYMALVRRTRIIGRYPSQAFVESTHTLPSTLIIAHNMRIHLEEVHSSSTMAIQVGACQ